MHILTVFLLMVFTSNIYAQILPGPDPYSFYMKINPKGSYLPTDTSNGDVSIPASTFDLSSFYMDPKVQLHYGDVIKLQVLGAYVNEGRDEFDTSKGLIAVFRNNRDQFLYPGVEIPHSSYATSPTCWKGMDTPLEDQITTDISQDFFIPSDVSGKFVQIPVGATSISFATNDCFKRNNSDPNFDFGIYIKLTIVPLSFHTKINNTLDLPEFRTTPSIAKSLSCPLMTAVDSKKKIHLFCNILPNVGSDRCKVKFNLRTGQFNGGHFHHISRFGELKDEMGESIKVNTFVSIPKNGLDIFYFAPDVSGSFIVDYEVRDILGNFVTFESTNVSVRAHKEYVNLNNSGIVFRRLNLHQEGTFGRREFQKKVENLVSLFIEHSIASGVPKPDIPNLYSEGANLEWGGLYDIKGNLMPSHCGHRNGRQIDLSLSSINASENRKVLKLALKRAVVGAGLNFPYAFESPDPQPDPENPGVLIEANHWHVAY